MPLTLPSNEYKNFDILAVYPKSEKLFHAACMMYDVDIICIAATEKQPFHCKRAPINGAIERGVFFEISYTAAIRDSTMKKYTIANAINLVEVCKGKNVILSSAAETTFRSSFITETRMTALGILYMKKKSQPPSEQPEEDTPALKRAKTEGI
ncbi:Ribonuclease P protein subunit p30 [Bagarius yarrelli]|uniref:Ribonuclease P protein subunit p30 n=1 Tax=Bagarius yarrelli TaxID=175774 RepID=A0A556TIQ6_BAGYA|nr:Ribonuclease P protein subunit p30 [Bagarius yarrelli]